MTTKTLSFSCTTTPLNKHKSLHNTKLHGAAEDESNDTLQSYSTNSISRRQSFTISLVSLFPLVSNMRPAQAAIPTIDDYENTNNGAQLISQTKLTKAQQQMIQTLAQPQMVENKQSIISLSETLIQSLNAMDPLVKGADWASIRSVLRGEGQYQGNALSMVRKTYFGVTDAKISSGTKGSQKVLKSILGPDVNGAYGWNSFLYQYLK